MRIAVISDIHGNMDAFESVLDDIASQEIENIFCLGDSIGYGPEPDRVINYLMKNSIPSVMGNHDNAMAHPEHMKWFNPLAKTSLFKTKTMLSAMSLTHISGLPRCLVFENCRFVHGFPPDRLDAYLFQVSEEEMHFAMRHMEETVCFVGHTHELRFIGFNGLRLEYDYMIEGYRRLETGYKYIINIGSVGQPRDGDKSAKYAVFDIQKMVLEMRFIPYDNRKTAKKILKAGLPRMHAARLL